MANDKLMKFFIRRWFSLLSLIVNFLLWDIFSRHCIGNNMLERKILGKKEKDRTRIGDEVD